MAQETSQEFALPEPPPGSIADTFREVLVGSEFKAGQTAIDVALTVRREDFARVMQMAKEDERLAFDFLRSVSGVDHLNGLEVVYHLYSYQRHHSVAIKVRCPYEDAHLPTVCHLWQTANWHERETHELFGIVFDGHPDLRPLLTEEGLGYYSLRKSHPLAEIEDWQEDYLVAVDQARAQAEAGPVQAAPAAPVDEKTARVVAAQKKAAIMKQVREEAKAKGLSPEEQKTAVQAAIKQFDEEQKAAAPAPAPAAPAGDRVSKIALAQQKAALIKKTREEARAQGLSPEDERKAVAEALKALAGEGGGG
ncbi:MAG: NADH-quinone oxidoreductase subunit C [Dehalococcoidia bacterium]